MTSNAIRESRAFLRYFARVKGEVCERFGPYTNNKEDSISKLVHKEWLCLSPNEQKFFYDPSDNSHRPMAATNNKHFIRYVTWNMEKIKSMYPKLPASALAKKMAPMYRLLPEKDKMIYGSLSLEDYYNFKADHVIYQRQQLRKIYTDPKELMLLEMISYSRPKKPLTSYQWFTRSIKQCLSVSTLTKWKALPIEERRIYIRKFQLDELRYTYENELWRSKFLLLNLDSFNFDPTNLFNCRLPIEEMEELAANYSNLPGDNIFYYYLSYIIKEYFLENGQRSIHDILKEATNYWNQNLASARKDKFNARYVQDIESHRCRLRRIKLKFPELIDKLVILDNLIAKARELKNHKLKLTLIGPSIENPSEQARYKLIERIN